jgi:hypothetical protein
MDEIDFDVEGIEGKKAYKRRKVELEAEEIAEEITESVKDMILDLNSRGYVIKKIHT